MSNLPWLDVVHVKILGEKNERNIHHSRIKAHDPAGHCAIEGSAELYRRAALRCGLPSSQNEAAQAPAFLFTNLLMPFSWELTNLQPGLVRPFHISSSIHCTIH